jgi:hypothetical protein
MEIVFVEIANELSFFIAHRGEHVDDLNIGRKRGRFRVLRVERESRGYEKNQRKSGQGRSHHQTFFDSIVARFVSIYHKELSRLPCPAASGKERSSL